MAARPTLELPIDAPAGNVQQYAASGPGRWANLVFEAGLSRDSSLLKGLSTGRLAIKVLFGPEDWQQAPCVGQLIGGGLLISGNALQVTHNGSWISFNRVSAVAPYAPVGYSDPQKKRVLFPRNTGHELPYDVQQIMHAMGVSTDTILESRKGNDMPPLVPYVYVPSAE